MKGGARYLPASDYDRLKSSTRLLLRAAGGGKIAAEQITRGSESRLCEAGAPHLPDRFLGIDQLADLEASVGDPALTRILADMLGYDLVKRPAPQARNSWPLRLAHLMAETSDVSCGLAEALADGCITPAERAALKAEALGAQAELAGMIAALDAEERR
jgi:hypothetical protein